MNRTKTSNRRRISQQKTSQEKRREVNTIPNRSLALAQEDAVTTRRAQEKEYTSAPTQRKASLPPHLLLLFLSLSHFLSLASSPISFSSSASSLRRAASHRCLRSRTSSLPPFVCLQPALLPPPPPSPPPLHLLRSHNSCSSIFLRPLFSAKINASV